MRAIRVWLLVGGIMATVGGCATMKAPDAAAISKLPVVELGQKPPEGNEYVLLLRSGEDIPVNISISGTFLAEPGQSTAKVQVKRDIYLYKKWTSFDGKTWDKKNVNLRIGTGLGPDGGKVNVTVDEIAK
jgi:hypothetical protein